MKPDNLVLPTLLSFCLLLLPACVSHKSAKPSQTMSDQHFFLQDRAIDPEIRFADKSLPAGIKLFADLVYAQPQNHVLALNLYAPASTMNELRPAIVLLHGAMGARRATLTPLAQQLALRGYVVATIDYRVTEGATSSQAIADTHAALHWLRQNSAEYGVDKTRVAVGGAGVGGQIAGLSALAYAQPDTHPHHAGQASAVAVVIGLDSLSDLRNSSLTNAFYGETISEDFWRSDNLAPQADNLQAASLIAYVKKAMPAVLLLTSNQTPMVADNDRMATQLHQYRVPHRVEHFASAPPHFWRYDPWVNTAASVIADFLDLQFSYHMMCHDMGKMIE